MRHSEQVISDAGLLQGWRKSTYSGANQGDCLEVADGYANIPVRDSKNPHGPALAFPAEGWTAFVSAVKNGRITP
ncbi:DUF397 domain-containing protein [Streptomyces sp. NBC_01020]|uniref:DUF397 domain-containing protein n=1 Tax=unclassified Streptomyces TaxID=2593676 RepID=UPI002254F4F2|nr:DUF397 domain-containing protein [Streptomyces sp. NBC_01306]MCX4726042.1 DUF397 domain-containing protein [Streptomyces sp. NBC_01306]WSV04608.1 DUF397 domain-containing protein [Streptomyces sp. NBC_01020]WSX42704.1 DUF397 domain-containing protein [Streptomyces sp. NBC_00963]